MNEHEKAILAAIAALADVTASTFAAHNTMIQFIGERTLHGEDKAGLVKHLGTLEKHLAGYQQIAQKLQAALK